MINSKWSSISIRQYTVEYTWNYEKLYRIICKHQAIYGGLYMELWETLQDHLQASGNTQWYIHTTMRNSTWSSASIRQYTVGYTHNYEKLYSIICKHQAIHSGIYMELWETLHDHLQAYGNTQWDTWNYEKIYRIICKYQAIHDGIYTEL